MVDATPRSEVRRAGGSASPDSPALDGRRRRSQRSRERILDAVARAISDPQTVLTPERIAARAGVSISTIFRHFDNIEGLAAAMRGRVAAKAMPYFTAGPFDGEMRARLRELLRRRSAIFEVVGPFRRAALRQPRWPRDARDSHERFKTALEAQMLAALGPELRGDPEAAPIIDMLLSIDAWTHLRVEQGLGVDAAAALVERAVLTQLGVRTAGR